MEIKYLISVIVIACWSHHNGPNPMTSVRVHGLRLSQLPPQRVPSIHINTFALWYTMAHEHARFGKWSIPIRSAIRIDDFLRETAWRSVWKICMHLMWFVSFRHTHVHAVSRNNSSIQITDLGDAAYHKKQRDAKVNINREANVSLHTSGGCVSYELLCILMLGRLFHFEPTRIHDDCKNRGVVAAALVAMILSEFKMVIILNR